MCDIFYDSCLFVRRGGLEEYSAVAVVMVSAGGAPNFSERGCTSDSDLVRISVPARLVGGFAHFLHGQTYNTRVFTWILVHHQRH